MTDLMRVRGNVAAIFVEDLYVEVPSDDTDLIDAGILDSLQFVELLVCLESQFGIQVSIDEIDLDDFRSISRIARVVTDRTRKEVASPT